MIRFTTATTDKELQQILALQKLNLPTTITTEELKKEGFVTVHHDLDLLREMNEPFPHILAKVDPDVVGYALVMLKRLKNRIPILIPMFQQVDALTFQNQALNEVDYFVMGQVCIQKGHRGKGIFQGLYEKMKEEMSLSFSYVITEVATRNVRSMRAHEKVGFQILKIYQGAEGEEWAILIWDWTNPPS